MIRILSGWSNPGGSTTAFINLTNALNEANYETVFSGPHPWHLNKCRAEQYTPGDKLRINKNDILIAHFKVLQQRPPVKGFFLSCHEQNIFPLQKIKYQIYDKIHFVSEHQKNFHNLNHPCFIIPNILDDLKPNENLKGKIGGIIGSIDVNKQIHTAIQNALEDGCETVFLYGTLNDRDYWERLVAPLVDGTRVIYKGYEENKQKMYDSFTDLYFTSIKECAPYVIGEAKMTKKVIHSIAGKNYLNIDYEFDKHKIVERWVKEIGI